METTWIKKADWYERYEKFENGTYTLDLTDDISSDSNDFALRKNIVELLDDVEEVDISYIAEYCKVSLSTLKRIRNGAECLPKTIQKLAKVVTRGTIHYLYMLRVDILRGRERW